MTQLGYKPDLKITDVLKGKRFTLSAEIIPPRNGTEQRVVLEQVQTLVKSGAEFLSVTKGAGGSLRGGSLPIAQAIKDHLGVPCIAHFTCRDLSPQEVENQLMDHHYFGIRNILALRGDPPQDQPDWKPKTDSYPYAYLLAEQIRKLNAGAYLARPGDPEIRSTQLTSAALEKTDFSIGVAAYPEHPNEKERLTFFKRKVDAGAEYGITQMIFDPEAYARFIDLCAANGLRVPILPGTCILKTKPQAERLAHRFGVRLDPAVLKSLPDSPTTNPAPSIEAFALLQERFKKFGAPGVHVFVLTDPGLASKVLSTISSS